MHPSLAHLAHRPWPLPDRPWAWRMQWRELGFLHLRVATKDMEPLLPPGLELDTFDGTAWVSVVPFRMADVRWRDTPALPGFSSFPELNVRTYVRRADRPGVLFFSLDATNLPFVLGARLLHGIPYVWSRIRLEASGRGFAMSSRRREGTPAAFDARVEPLGEARAAEPGSFAHWVAERYCLYSRHRGRLWRTEVHHAPWELREACFEVRSNDLLAVAGIRPLDATPVAHHSAGTEVVAFAPEAVG